MPRFTIKFDGEGATLVAPGVARRVTQTVLICAHPDDEVLGAGSRLTRLGDLTIVHVTDGAPRNMVDASAQGFSDREHYARARRTEFNSALKVAGSTARTVQLGIPEQEAAANVLSITRLLVGLLNSGRADLILTHAYEGGHPDHDGCALAVSMAVRLLAPPRIPVFEFAGYHAVNGWFRAAEFLPSDEPVTTVRLGAAEQAEKRRMLACFRTQRETISLFPIDVERYRPAPTYDFSRAPHQGPLYYERYGWSMDGATFRRMASEAAAKLGFAVASV
jgi:N-acetylglucosamine malate deacetylase 2